MATLRPNTYIIHGSRILHIRNAPRDQLVVLFLSVPHSHSISPLDFYKRVLHTKTAEGNKELSSVKLTRFSIHRVAFFQLWLLNETRRTLYQFLFITVPNLPPVYFGCT